MDRVKYPGITIMLAGEPRVMPDLNLAGAQEFEERMSQPNAISDKNLAVDTITSALQRNYPQITREDVLEGIGLRQLMDVFGALLRYCGYLPTEAEEGKARATTEAGTGPSSMPISQPVSAGPSSTADTTSA